jgi:lipopolysaccharide assembly outer membrane protein LptD (OstA)
MRRESRVVTCAAALLLASGALLADGDPPDTTAREGMSISPQVAGKGPANCVLEISAGPGSVLDADDLTLKEYVDIKCGDLRLQADLVHYIPSTHEAHAEGNVVLDQARVRITADSLDYNLETGTGQFINARGYAEPTILFEAKRVEQTSKDTLVLEDASFTACTQPTPYWSFKIARGILKLDDYAYLHDLSFKLGGVTVFYSPYLVWPIKTDRVSGLLFPEFGFSNRSGTIISDAWYWAMNRSMDSTVYFDYMSKSGYGSGLEYRYVPSETGKGLFSGYYIRDQVAKEENQPGVPVDRWVIDYQHQQEINSEWRFVANANFVSDFDYYLDFERDLRVSSQPQAISKAYLSRNWGFYSLNMWTERREQLVQEPIQPTAYGEPILSTEESTIVRWVAPEIEFRSRRQKIDSSPFFVSLESSVDHLDKGEADSSYERADVYPQIASQLSPVPWLDVNANASVRDTYYTRSQGVDLGCDNLPDTHDFGEGNGIADIERDNDPVGVFGPEDDLGCDNIPGTGDYGEGNGVRDRERTVALDDNLDRRLYQAGLEIVGPKISRVFDTPGSSFSPQYKNTIEPTLRYSYISSIDNPNLVIPFDEVDTVPGESNRLTYGFTTRLFARRPVTTPSEMGFAGQLVPGETGSLQDAVADMMRKSQEDRTREAAEQGGEAGAATPGAAEGAGTPGTAGQHGAPSLNTIEVATLEIVQDYSFLGPLSVSTALQEQRPVSPIRGTLRYNPSINTSIDVRTSFDVLFNQVREASLSANLRSPGRGYVDLTWTMARDLEGKALEDEGLAFATAFNRSQLGLTSEATLFARRLLLGFQINYEMGDVLPGEPRMRDQRYRAGYNTQCCGYQFEYLNRNFTGSNQNEFRFLINLKGVGNVIDFHQRTGSGGY